MVKWFPQLGDLYVSTISGLPVVNTLFLILEKDLLKDWHIILGHPSDFYVKKFLELMNIKTPGKTGSSNE